MYDQQQPRQWQPEVVAAQKQANNSLIFGILGLVICAILAPIAIVQARKAKQVLRPGDPSYGSAQAGEILGWIGTVLWVLGILVYVVVFVGILGAGMMQ